MMQANKKAFTIVFFCYNILHNICSALEATDVSCLANFLAGAN